MGVLSAIFGGSKVIEEGFKLIDSMHTSTEEEIVAKTQAKVDLLNAYSGFKVAQRYIAFLFTINFIASFWAVVYLWATDKDMQGFIEIMQAFSIGSIMLVIVGFYYGGGAFEGVVNRFKKAKDS